MVNWLGKRHPALPGTGTDWPPFESNDYAKLLHAQIARTPLAESLFANLHLHASEVNDQARVAATGSR
ncbi:MAG: hypothetical protein IPH35_11385 [Rhodoferax sp.]|nr:hypothetical protein [Rhodoferax sp.]